MLHFSIERRQLFFTGRQLKLYLEVIFPHKKSMRPLSIICSQVVILKRLGLSRPQKYEPQQGQRRNVLIHPIPKPWMGLLEIFITIQKGSKTCVRCSSVWSNSGNDVIQWPLPTASVRSESRTAFFQLFSGDVASVSWWAPITIVLHLMMKQNHRLKIFLNRDQLISNSDPLVTGKPSV